MDISILKDGLLASHKAVWFLKLLPNQVRTVECFVLSEKTNIHIEAIINIHYD